MKVKEKIRLEHEGFCENGPVNIVILGDSVSQGSIIENCDYENVYWNRLRKKPWKNWRAFWSRCSEVDRTIPR